MDELKPLIDEVLARDKQEGERVGLEKQLFKDSLLTNTEQFRKVPNERQVAAAWQRWKQERGLIPKEGNQDLWKPRG